MANIIPPWLKGRNITVSLTPQDVSAAGILSNNAVGAISFVARLDDVGSGLSNDNENISPMDCTQFNPVFTEQSVTYTLSEVLSNIAFAAGAGAGGFKLLKASQASRYHYMVITYKDDAGVNVVVESGYVFLLGYDPQYRKGKCVGQARFITHALWDNVGLTWVSNPQFTGP